MRIGLLGGTFDPPHLGHLGVAEAALSSPDVDEVWLVPCLRHRFGKQPVDFKIRIEMCRLLVDGRAGMRVSEMEANIDKPGQTLALVRAFLERYPEHEYRLVAGADIYHQRHQWYRYDEIARLAPPLYVARRGVEPIDEPALPAPVEISSSDVRAALLAGSRVIPAIPKDILDYIDRHQLYAGAV